MSELDILFPIPSVGRNSDDMGLPMVYECGRGDMEDILARLANSSSNESSHELQCRCFDAAEEISRLRFLLKRTLPMISRAGCGILAAEINNAVGVPNVEVRDRAFAAPASPMG